MEIHEKQQLPLHETYLFDSKVVFEPINDEIFYCDKTVKLAYSESRILHLLSHHAGEIISREQLTEYSWTGRVVADTSLMKSISNIRKALREFGLSDEAIATIPRVGYRLSCIVVKKNEAQQNEIPSESYSNATKGYNKDNQHEVTPYINLEINDINNKKNAFMSKLKVFVIVSSLIMLGLSAYNFLWRIDRNLDEDYLDKGYEIIDFSISNKKLKIIKPKGYIIVDDIKSFISLAPDLSLVFVQKRGGGYSISYFYQGTSMSFNFSEAQLTTAKSQIKSILSD